MATKKKKVVKNDEVETFDLNNIGEDFVDVPGDFGVNWVPEKEGDKLEGKITGMDYDIVIPGQKKPGNVCRVLGVDGVSHSVWQSATLKNFFSMGNAVLGMRVRFTFNGLGTKKKGQNAPKLIKVQLAK